MNEINSNFFNFEQKLTSNKIQSSHYLGWNNLLIIKFEIIKNNIFDKKIIDTSYPDLRQTKNFCSNKRYFGNKN